MTSVVPSRPRQTNLYEIPKRSELQYTGRWSKERLAAFRLAKDPIADAVVAELHARKGLTNIYDLFGTVKDNAENDKSPAGDVFRAFIKDSERVPSWVDWNQVKRGNRVQATYSNIMGPALFAGSLVGGSMFPSMASVTASAGNMAENPTGRVEETAMIIATLAFESSLEPGGEARTVLIRVRLLHAALRHWLPATGRYDRTDEPPIHQHDLAITLALFGYINLRSLALMGAHLTRQETTDYIAMWRFAGFILGLDEDILPTSLEDQEEFFLASCIEYSKPELMPVETKYLLDLIAYEANSASYGAFPYFVARVMLHQLTRYLAGDEYCSGMQLRNLGDNHWSLWPFKAFGMTHTLLAHYVPFGQSALVNLNTFLIRKNFERYHRQKGLAGGGMKEAGDASSILKQAHERQAGGVCPVVGNTSATPQARL